LFAFLARLTRAARSTKEVWLTLTQVGEPVQRVLLGTIESSNKGHLILDLSPAAFDSAILFLAVLVAERALNVHPFASVPKAALHLAALGHFKAIQRVAVTAEQTSNKVILSAEFAASEIEFLPPVLVVAVLSRNGLLEL